MNEEDRNTEFRKMADSFIDVANKHCDEIDNTKVASAQLFATARFSAFVVASRSKDLQDYDAQIAGAVDFFSNEFKRMLTENLEEYKAVFAKRQQDTPKYQHLIKDDRLK